jgi:peptidoglycan/LPS O-acetylase OafA/YrhL
MAAPPLLLDRPPAQQIAVAVGGPVVAGIICGIILGINGTAYTILTLVLVIGGVAGGYEHPTADEGSVRGLCSGLVFGACIVATSAVSGMDAKATLPHPPGFLPVLTGIITMFLGALGGWLRKRHEAKQGEAGRIRASAASG